jgi:dTDP-D-glucose 4,6-dehydratase
MLESTSAFGKFEKYLVKLVEPIYYKLGWQEQVSFEKGLEDCVRWVQDNFDALKAQPYDYIHKP